MEFLNFPQPTRPTSFSKLTSFKYSAIIIEPAEPIVLQDSEPTTSISRLQQPDEYIDEVFDELTKILFECLENVDNKNKGPLLRKIFLELEKGPMENFILEKLKNTQVKVISELLERYTGSLIDDENGENKEKRDQQETVVSRGVNNGLTEAFGTGESISSEFSRKLERFKVKTLNIEGGVIKK